MFLSKTENKKQIISWSFYDFANQPYSTLIITFIYSAFFVNSIAVNEQEGTFLWANAISITAITVALISPVLGAFADHTGYRKFLLVFFTIICSIFTGLLYFPGNGDVFLALIFVVISNIAFEMGTVFCNSYLKDLSNEDNIGKVSGFAWGLGFIGGLTALFIAFLFFDVNQAEDVKLINIFVGVWFLLFSLPTFLFLKDNKRQKISRADVSSSFHSISRTFKEISEYKKVVRFLIARLFYNDGLVTIFALGGVYAVGTLDFSMKEVLILGIVLNIFAAIGSFVFGSMEDRIGVRNVINISLIVLIVSTIFAFIAPLTAFPKEVFWLAGIMLGTMIGPNQSCSRSYMSQITPNNKKNEFFGFYALTGKATSFLGPLLFGLITKIYSQQMALLSVLVFFVIGLIMFNRSQD
ncbi:MAG: MFS transporter [Flavobacteriales bacterium]|jgi:MFS transporter, UMF1 family|nr:MFS transporter [Flavobacteriales bacterium]